MISVEDIKELREKTGAGISEVRSALMEAKGDKERAMKVLERSLGARGGKKSERATRGGVVDCYIHSDHKIGVLIEVLCETDFVARNVEFKTFVHDVAMHIAATNPLYIRREDVPEDVIRAERRLIEEGVLTMQKPKEILEQIISGKMDSHFKDITLMDQPFVKDPDKTIGQVVLEAAGKFGENIKISRFIRFAL
ncbi:MAG: elongation factor Ts [bacterium]|nr:elongation factor Ts [bacterium]